MKFFRIVLILAVYAAAAGIGGYMWVESYYTGSRDFAEPKTIIIKKGASISKIAYDLEELGVIKYPRVFTQLAKYTKQTSPKFGEYLFQPGVSPKQILYTMQNGKTVIRKIKIAEGKTVYEVLEILRNTPGLEGNLPTNIEEGSIMPTTYYYHWGDQYEDVVKQMQDEMRKTVTDLWPYRKADLPIMTSKDALILASIVEKETGYGDERQLVASVFINRIRKGMKLESDPTAVYGITKGAPLGRMPSHKDMDIVNEYNTYKIPGLPPTPICNPGKAAIQAVLNPSESEYIFFVANGKGGHNFGTTMEEHLRNIQLYRQALKNQSN